ncbi:RNA recognition motif domain protein [Actinidia chinensis var. chinensis]|uniref:RNA recognition motif domain protein n=1 Tax=Actinidia chinensis var. chinensis TaxID=1590841 RepID=A0A2R6PXC5_ACTCC|nr:RNA recognition motif domain protein [Actinidia chinensis var. chinensis]
MSSSSASSLHFLSLTPTSISLSNSKPTSLSLSSLKPPPKPLSLSPSLRPSFQPLRSDFELQEALNDSEVPNFSPDLKLYVGNLPFSVDSATLAELFERAGNVEMVIYDKITGRSRGFGFVTMSTVEEVEAATRQFNGHELDGRALRVSSGPPPPKGESSFRGSRGGLSVDNTYRVYVGNLAWGVDDLALETLFRGQGKVVEAKVVYDKDSGRSRGFGFVTYCSADEVSNAIESLDGVDLNGRQIQVSMAEARPRRQF